LSRSRVSGSKDGCGIDRVACLTLLVLLTSQLFKPIRLLQQLWVVRIERVIPHAVDFAESILEKSI